MTENAESGNKHQFNQCHIKKDYSTKAEPNTQTSSADTIDGKIGQQSAQDGGHQGSDNHH
jgi:hypothetical protein